MDDLGIVYEWGNGQTKPKTYDKITVRVIDMAAGKSQNAFVTTKGKVIGYGNIINGEIPGITNAIKVAVTNDSIIILTSDLKVYEYKAGALNQIQITPKVIDISANGTSVMLQTVDEETYVLGANTNGELGTGTNTIVTVPQKVNIHGENTFGISAGINNTYIIENTGNVYASGNNTYGQLGNGTRTDELEHTLVGDRDFKIEPKTATMKVRRHRRNKSYR